MEAGQNGDPMANAIDPAEWGRNTDIERALILSHNMMDATVLVVLNNMHLAK